MLRISPAPAGNTGLRRVPTRRTTARPFRRLRSASPRSCLGAPTRRRQRAAVVRATQTRRQPARHTFRCPQRTVGKARRGEQRRAGYPGQTPAARASQHWRPQLRNKGNRRWPLSGKLQDRRLQQGQGEGQQGLRKLARSRTQQVPLQCRAAAARSDHCCLQQKLQRWRQQLQLTGRPAAGDQHARQACRCRRRPAGGNSQCCRRCSWG